MNQSIFARHKGLIFATAGLVVIIIAFWLINGSTDQPLNQTPTVDSEKATPAAIAPTSLLSPTSPTSPLSPLPASPVLTPADQEAIQAMLQKGIQLQENGEYEAAIDVFDKILADYPNDILAYNARGAVYTALANYQKALDDFTRAIELEPTFAPAYYNRGRVYGLMKKYDEAFVDLEKSIAISPHEFGYRANGNIGLIYHQLGEYDKALEAFGEAIAFTDTKADTYYLRGETYTALKNYEAAIDDYQAAITRFPRYDLAYQSLGYAYYKTGQFEPAFEALNKALDISPDSPTAHFYLALLHLATGNPNEASAAIKQAIKSINALPKEERNFLLSRVLTDLETFAQDHPAQVETVESLIDMIPEPG